ncbi:zinc metalloprotease [Palaeococcus ferrophilus]|uniref:hypothetical protein n=1 Tax=Palaeococcus ferrophilus TaxID=83868 RepID=UPI00064F2D11|nr:hypothetical protein [Palaeococcus ferrophilus]
MELVGITFITNLLDSKIMDEGVIYRIYEKTNEYLDMNDIHDIRLVLLRNTTIDRVYLMKIHSPNGPMRAYPLNVLVDTLYHRLLEEREDLLWKREENILEKKSRNLPEVYDSDRFKFNKIIGIVSFPLVDRNNYFGYFEKFLGVQKRIGDKSIMVLSMLPFLSVNGEIFAERIAKGILHEIGHAFGLDHCEEDCPMHPPARIEDWDERSPFFCPKCLTELKRNAGWI